MNIAEAKEQIKRSVQIYLMKNDDGTYRIPVQKQRPAFLYGAPGIGKTAIMEQIAEELDINLVSYSMTHHTRQSALGLPFIVQHNYGGKEYDISRYTMSEIIANVYDKIEESGRSEGILFLDEINCVSETLGPAMLQFLQYKTFGNHAVPEGWVIVTAGNPPEYNRSVKEFDVVTMDRLKIMEIEPEYEAWRRYAVKRGLHKSILSYLDIRKQDFYEIENTVDGKSYVTARGWEDLSEAIYLFEESGFPVDETLISQYIRSSQICGEFSVYYALYNKNKADYQISRILEGAQDQDINEKAKNTAFDERITILGLLTEAVQGRIKKVLKKEDYLKKQVVILRERKAALADGASDSEKQTFEADKTKFENEVARMKQEKAAVKENLNNMFRFIDKIYGEGNEMLIAVTEMTMNRSSARFIAANGCEEYFKHDKHYQLYERNKELMHEIEVMENGENGALLHV